MIKTKRPGKNDRPKKYRLAKVEVFDTIDRETIELEYFYDFEKALEDYDFFKSFYDKNCYNITLTFIEDM